MGEADRALNTQAPPLLRLIILVFAFTVSWIVTEETWTVSRGRELFPSWLDLRTARTRDTIYVFFFFIKGKVKNAEFWNVSFLKGGHIYVGVESKLNLESKKKGKTPNSVFEILSVTWEVLLTCELGVYKKLRQAVTCGREEHKDTEDQICTGKRQH